MESKSAAHNFLLFRVYDNLKSDAANHVPTATDPDNYAGQLLKGFLNNNDFRATLISAANKVGRDDIQDEIAQLRDSKHIARNDMANGLMKEIDSGNTVILADLADYPATPDLSAAVTMELGQLESFFKLQAITGKEDLDLNTHIQADPRYMAYFDQYAGLIEMSGSSFDNLRNDALSAHKAAAKTLNEMEYDGSQMDLYQIKEAIFEAVEKGNIESLGYDLAKGENNTVFDKLKVAQPVSEAELKKAQSPLQREIKEPDITPAKEMAIAEKTPAIEDQEGTHIDENTIKADALKEPFYNAAKIIPLSPPAVKSEQAGYTVQKNDSVWKIAKNQYGLKSYKDIMRASDHIAQENGLTKGTDANWIKEGDTIKLPSAEKIQEPANSLDWNKLSNDPKLNQPALAG